jgi:MFS family permease
VKRFIKNLQITADREAPHGAGSFFTIWMGQALSLLGSKLVGMFPQVVLGPFVGALVDRWNRRRIMIVSEPAHAGERTGDGRYL